MNSCTFINTKSHNIPKYLRKGIEKYTFSDVSNKLPVNYAKGLLECSERELANSGIVIAKTKIAKKPFYIFDNDFIKKTKGFRPYILDEREMNECLENGTIQNYIKIKRNKYLVWY